MKKNDYMIGKEKARAAAIEWQNSLDYRDCDWLEMAEAGADDG